MDVPRKGSTQSHHSVTKGETEGFEDRKVDDKDRVTYKANLYSLNADLDRYEST